MPKLRYGNYNQVAFDSWEEYYYTLGFLANSHNAEVYWESNDESGAWGSEGRIHCLIPESRFPQCFRFTTGTGRIFARVNCNEYVNNLIFSYHFKEGGNSGNIQSIVNTVPDKYLNVFQNGYGGKIPLKQQTENKRSFDNRPKYNNPNFKVGHPIKSKAYGIGIIEEITEKYVLVKFDDTNKKFQNPEAFTKGFLTFEED